MLLVALVAAVAMGMRHGKPVVLDNPIIVHQAGQYHITLAPQLSPRDGDSHLKNLREFSEAVLLHHPLAEPVNMQTMDKL